MTVADELAALLAKTTGVAVPVRLRAWDGSVTGPDEGPTVHVRDRAALRRLLWRPGELGLAQAYITGEIDVEGDLADGLRRLHREPGARRPGPAAALAALPFALRHKLIGPPPPAPVPQASVKGRRHSRERDRAVISHHYDLSNDFYRLILDPQMVYSCGYWRREDPEYGLADAQRDKLELICRKLGLRPGMRMLDVGCGWGALALHAAARHGVTVVGVTLSKRQHHEASARAIARDLRDRVDFRLADYRELDGERFDAISTVEMGEHVGERGYPAFAARLRGLLEPGGRLLVQQMSRGTDEPGGGAFIETYIAPDMHMRPVGRTVDMIEAAGFEVRDVEAMREHYVRTIRAWHQRFETHWDEAVALVGEPTARVWRLYLVGVALTFEAGRMGVDQILAVAQRPGGVSDMPPTRAPFTLNEEIR